MMIANNTIPVKDERLHTRQRYVDLMYHYLKVCDDMGDIHKELTLKAKASRVAHRVYMDDTYARRMVSVLFHRPDVVREAREKLADVKQRRANGMCCCGHCVE